MTEPDLSLELETLVNAMANSARLLYRAHSIEFKFTALVVLAYFAYRLGRSTVTDPLDDDVKDMSKALKNRQHYTVSLPQKMKKLATIRKILFFGFAALSIFIISIFYFKHEIIKARTQQQLYAGLGTIALLFLGSICLWIYEVIIRFAINKGGFNDHAIQKKISSIVETLGKKTELLIKGHLCRQKYLSRRNKPSTAECSKNNCRQYRKLWKQKTEDISRMVETVLNFEWCSVCRKRVPFDEFLSFESRVYHKNEQLPVETEVAQRNQYLLSELERMGRWVQQVSPCNCSKRYWIESTKQIRQFKKQEKANNQQLSLYEAVKAK